MRPNFAENPATARLLRLIRPAAPDAAGDSSAGDWKGWLDQLGFTGAAGQLALVPDGAGALSGAAYGLGAGGPRAPRFQLAAALADLPEGDWRVEHWPEGLDAAQSAFAALLSQYAFDRYRSRDGAKARLVQPNAVDGARLIAMAEAEFLTRDLINTPANDMGPEALEQAARDMAGRNGFEISVRRGDELLARNFPLIHAVGRAGAEAPRLIELTRGVSGPQVTLVGKGVCFDTGGLNLKPGSSMGLMKKDMGGAATVLGLAQMLAATGAADGFRLRVLIPAVENAVAGNAFRPGDILTSRKGLTVEVNNTDAEGRLVLADALAYAAEDAPDVLVSMATLTGAARVALGPDIPPFYCDDDATAAAISEGAEALWDPLWRMPFWAPYEEMIEPGIADLDNAPAGGVAGSITAALFLRRFTEGAKRYAHFDIYGWTPKAAPGRPKGGVGQGARALLHALPRIVG